MRFNEAPTSFHFWVGVGTVAGALRRKVWTDHLTYQYTPNFYIILVAPPGVATKSTAIRSGISYLRRIKGVHLGPQSVTWQALFDSLKTAVEVVKVPGTDPIRTVAYSALTLGISELGTFFRPDNKEFMDHLTNIWDAQKEVIGRKTLKDGEITIENPWLNIIAGTTPGWLKENFPKVMVEGGLASRLVFVFQDKKQRLIAYPELLEPNADFKLEEEALLYDLQQIGNLCGQYKLTEAAYKWGTMWYERIHEAKPSGITSSERFQGYMSRKQAMVHKLAMALAAGKTNELVIDDTELIEAEAHLTSLEGNLSQVFDSIGVTPEANITNEIVSTIRRHGKPVSYKLLFQAFSKTIDGTTYKRAIMHALEAGLLTKEVAGGEIMLRHAGKD